MAESVKMYEEKNIQVIWQTGKNYFEKYRSINSENIKVYDFIDDMNTAYSACDLLLARAGATTIAELLNLGIPSILVPSPNVAENHQYHNAKFLNEKDAAVLIEDKSLKEELQTSILKIISSNERLSSLKNNAVKLAKPDATRIIAQSVIQFAEVV
jgi:UDP-N-acetylglucosamine--N-acetylmuramyl-(pentapeptide) pyrophosphoryl-undecaprenol N-acetylglucosamine transferase